MNRLKKGLYMSDQPSILFGLQHKQIKPEGRVLYNCSWFNKNAEKLGHGDLTHQNLVDIKNGLKSDELFIIFGEGTSDFKGIQPQAGQQILDLAIEHIARNAAYVIGSEKCYYVVDQQYSEAILEKSGISFITTRRVDFEPAIKKLLIELFKDSVDV